MNCIGPLDATRFLTGDLPAERRAEIALHLDGCDGCTARVETARLGIEVTSPHATFPALAAAPGAEADPVSVRTQPGTPLPVPMMARTLPPGQMPRGTPVDRYLIIERLGMGGMGAVYRAYDPELDRRIALKLLRAEPGSSSDEAHRARLIREARAMARLTHPNTVGVYDAGVYGQRVFVAMELIDGPTLDQWLKQRPRTWGEILTMFGQAGRGLAAAHAARLVHRDFKAENVLVGADGRPRVTDFGLAHLERRSSSSGSPGLSMPPTSNASLTITADGMMVGTPAYMSPEQFRGEATDARTDQFNFCAALYEALYGMRPFPGDDLRALMATATTGRISPPPKGTLVPTWVRELLLRGLSIRAEDRHPSMTVLLDALAYDRKAQRRRWLAGALAVSAVALTIGVGVHALHREQTRCARDAHEAIAPFWSPAREAALRQHLGSEASVAPTLAALTAFVHSWESVRAVVCEQGRQKLANPTTLELREACLDDLAASAATLADLELEADLEHRPRVQVLIDELVPPSICAQAGAPKTRVADVAPALRSQLARGDVFLEIGQNEGASGVATQVLQDPSAGPLARAQALQLRGRALLRRQEHLDQAVDDVRECIRLAEAEGADLLEARCRVSEVQTLGQSLNRYDEATRAARDAHAALDRAGASDKLRAELDRVEGNMAVNRGDHQGVDLLQHSLERLNTLYGRDVPSTAWAYNDLGRAVAELDGDGTRAAQLFRRAAEIDAAAYGPTHPELATFFQNAGDAEMLAAHPELAVPLFNRALTLAEGAEKDSPADVADVLAQRAVALLDLQRPDEAKADLTRAEILLRGLEPDSSTATTLEIAWARLALGAQDPGARAHAEKAVKFAEQRPGEVDTLAQARFVLARSLPATERALALEQAKQALSLLSKRTTPLAKHLAEDVRRWQATASP